VIAGEGPGIRKANAQDIPAIGDAMARAFHDDPVVNWVFRDERTRPKYAHRYFAGRARILMRQQEIYTVDGGQAVAMWARPNEWHDPPLQSLKELAILMPAVKRRIPQTLRGLLQIEAHHPKSPHWYLAVLGTDPDRQGEGIGSALLQPVLEGCDRDEVPAYLETGTERNVAFYTRMGFKVTHELSLPKGPPMWLMWREPRP
jgi:ribosomal protein S18 acetylase RimI-like enzyme